MRSTVHALGMAGSERCDAVVLSPPGGHPRPSLTRCAGLRVQLYSEP